MSEIANYKKMSLGETEQMFVIFFALRNYSAYGLWSHLKNQKKMSYKNVFTKIKRLVELGLLEEQGKFKRNAIRYKLTTRGLFERLTLSGWHAIHPIIWYDYKDNVILQTLLFQFFDTQTIWNLRGTGYITISALITNYLKRCCESIVSELDSNKFTNESIIEQIIKNEFSELILKIVMSLNLEKEYSTQTGKLTPLFITLREDKKVFDFLYKMKNDFDKGCKRLGL